MILAHKIIELLIKNNYQNTDWYNWRNINENKLPNDILLPNGNQYFKNIALKNQLHLKWTSATDLEEKKDLIKYYIKDWGGIRGNSETSMTEYTTQTAEILIQNGIKGIASWSKALVVHNPKIYAIYDARVSVSINCIQYIFNTDKILLYPILPSQNKLIKQANSHIKNISNNANWNQLDNDNFYQNEYLPLLNSVAIELKSDISTIEMFLFAKAEEMAREAFHL